MQRVSLGIATRAVYSLSAQSQGEKLEFGISGRWEPPKKLQILSGAVSTRLGKKIRNL